METLRKVVRCLDRCEDIAIFLVCITLFFAGAYALYDSYLVYQEANDTSLLKYKPGYGENVEADKEIQGNMAAWLTLDDTTVDYPVMQGETNTEYLNKNPFGEYSMSGSIFLDSRNQADFSDSYSLIYGHHMEHGLMFGALDEFLDEQYFNTHRSGKLIAGNVTYEIRIFAVVEAEATNEAIFAPTVTDVSETLNYIEKHALFLDKEVYSDGAELILGMSTCKYPDTVERTIVFGKLYNSGNQAEPLKDDSL